MKDQITETYVCKITAQVHLRIGSLLSDEDKPLAYAELYVLILKMRFALFVWLISHQAAVLFSQNKPTVVLFSQNKSAPAKRTRWLNFTV
jgi:hypothetical protein